VHYRANIEAFNDACSHALKQFLLMIESLMCFPETCGPQVTELQVAVLLGSTASTA